jgi:16S rRNA (cytosine967-C5)-methyltransferase
MASTSTTKNNPLLAVRGRELRRLWAALLEREPFPQVDRWLSEEFRRNAKYGSRDRKWYAEMMFSAVRYGLLALFLEDNAGNDLEAFRARYPDLDAVQAAWRRASAERFFVAVGLRHVHEAQGRMATPDDVALVESLEASLAREPSHAEMSARLEAFLLRCDEAASRIRDAGQLTGSDDSTLAALEAPLRYLLLKAGIPMWYAAPLLARARLSAWDGETLERFVSMQNSRSPLWLRLNSPERATEVVAELHAETFETTLVGPDALKATGAKGIFATSSYRNGLFEIQDLASQGIGRAVDNQPGDTVWDCCAGGGGKTMQIAARARNKGVIYASDVREYKLDEVKKRARRAGFFNIRCVPWQGESLPVFPKEIARRAGFDWVLVDAPCSSSGTWRRNPDAKYRTLPQNITNLGTLQLQLLTRASEAVRPGGRLVYSTCSWLVDENESIAERFLASCPDFRLVSNALLGAPDQDADTMFAVTFVRGGA